MTNLSYLSSSNQAAITNLLNDKSRNYRTIAEWKLISCLESFSFFINSNECNECVNSRYNAKDLVLKRKKKPNTRSHLLKQFIDKASRKFENFRKP